MGQSPAGLPCVEQRPVQNYVTLFESLLAESIDARAPGFDDAVDSLVAWVSQEESQKVAAIEKGQTQLTELREANHQLNADINELLGEQGSIPKMQIEIDRLRAECAEYHSAVNQLEQDLLDRLTDNENLAKTVEMLKAKVKSHDGRPATHEKEISPSSYGIDTQPSAEKRADFVFADSFAKEAELSEILLRADILAVNRGEADRVNWTDAFQATVNKNAAYCIENRRPWRTVGHLHNSGLSVIHIAALIGNPDMVKAWLQESVHCCTPDSRGNTILHWCFMSAHMRKVGLGFMGDEAMSVVVSVCDYLREVEGLDSLLELIFAKNRSGLALVSEQGELNDELVRDSGILLPVKNYLAEALQYIATHQTGARALVGRRYDWASCSAILSLASFRLSCSHEESSEGNFKLLVNLDQKKDNLLSYRVTRPDLRFGDESVVNYSLLGCDQLGYLQQSDFKKKISPSTMRSSGTSTVQSASSNSIAQPRRLGFSTIGTVLSLVPCIERQWAHIVVIGDSIYIHSESAAFVVSKNKSEAPYPITQMECHPLKFLKLLHVMEGYESMILLRFSRADEGEQGSSASPSGGVFDLIIETEFKPHLILAICVHYYTFCKPIVPSYSSGNVNILAPPIKVDLNNYNVVPVFYGEKSPIAAIVLTRFPHSNVLGECMIVSCRSSSVAVPRYLGGFTKIATVSYITNLKEAIAGMVDTSGTIATIDTVGQSALCILHENRLLELFATPLDDDEIALFRLDLNPATSFIRAIPFDSDRANQGQNNDGRQSVATVTSSIFNHISKLLDLSQLATEAWYAIKFQEAKDEKNTAAAAIGFGIKEERDDWMCLLYS